jgi:chromosome segregation ATPase
MSNTEDKPLKSAEMSVEVSHCVQVSNRKATYESRIATHNSLLDLGKSLATREKNQQSREEKRIYLMSAIKDLDNFDGNIFMTEYEKSKDKNLHKAKTYSLVRYISIFKELHTYMIADIKELNTKIVELSEEIADQNSQLDGYISQMDEADESMAVKVDILTRYRQELKALRSEIEIQEIERRNRILANKCTNIQYKFVIWGLIITQVSSMLYYMI